MTPENQDRLKTALRAIDGAFDEELDAACALHFINPAVSSASSDDTQYTVAKMITAMSSVMHFLDTDSVLTDDERAGFGWILESCAQALFVNVTLAEIRRESKPPRQIRTIGAAR
jgi:hypothetical protein